MTLERGITLGPYEVLAPLGAGGMGEVFRARDAKLGREVALKILPEAFSHDPERVARFEREARALAALNHPSIAAIHGFEEQDGIRFLVLELVPGTTLAERLLRGPLPLREALALCGQIAEALATAHEQGLIHRDLKPSNVNVTPDGHAKLLDFGLARFCAPQDGGADAEDSPTLTTPATSEGVVHGTAAYMSPEQARGEELDRRCDIWSFGCILFETLTGRRAFPGQTVSDTIAAVLEREPDWELLPPETPEGVRALLRRCLRKDRPRRFHDATDAQLELEEALGGTAPPAATPVRKGEVGRRALWASAVVVLTLCASWYFFVRVGDRHHADSAPPTPQRFEVSLPNGAVIPKGGWGPSALALSRDGSHLAFVASGRLYLRRTDELEPRMIAEGVVSPNSPFLSPDGEWLGFHSENRLILVRTDGTGQRTVTQLPSLRGADWSEDDRILIATGDGELAWVAPEGGEPRVVATSDPARGLHSLRWPQVLPGGRFALATALGPTLAQKHWKTVLVSLEDGSISILLDAPAGAGRYLPSGHLVYLQGNTGSALAATMSAIRFDPASMVVQGPAVTLIGGVHVGAGSAAPYYAVADTGTLVYAPASTASPDRELAWVDRRGHLESASAHRREYWGVYLSPDTRCAAVELGVQEAGNGDIWLLDREHDVLTRLTSTGSASSAAWSPDGRFVLFGDEGGLYRVRADRSAPVEPLSSTGGGPYSITPDGQELLISRQEAGANWDLYLLPLKPGSEPRPWLVTPTVEVNAAVSPDGLWVAYRSHESGSPEIHVRPLTGGGPVVALSGGSHPRWSRDGSELFFTNLRHMMVASKTSDEPLVFDPPRPLFELPKRALSFWSTYDVAPDGRFLMILQDPRESEPLRLVVAPRWFDEVEAKMAQVDE